MTNQKMEVAAISKADFGRLLEQIYPLIYRQAYKLAGNRQDAEDLTQETCYRALRGVTSFQEDQSFANWTHKILKHIYFDMRRRRSRRPPEVSHDVHFNLIGESDRFFEPADTRPTPEEVVLDKQLSEDLEQALKLLLPCQVELVHKADIKAIDLAELAELEKLTSNVIRSRLHRAHRKMRKHLLSHQHQEIPEQSQTVTDGSRVRQINEGPLWSQSPLTLLVRNLFE